MNLSVFILCMQAMNGIFSQAVKCPKKTDTTDIFSSITVSA